MRTLRTAGEESCSLEPKEKALFRAAFDFYGANRAGDNLFANTLLALKAATGERVWHFQAVRHDLWDRDFPAPPNLVTLRRNGRRIDAVAQITKSGHVFVFERETGKPLFPIEYRKYPASTVEGEVTAETQPLPTKPAPFARQLLTLAKMSWRCSNVSTVTTGRRPRFRQVATVERGMSRRRSSERTPLRQTCSRSRPRRQS